MPREATGDYRQAMAVLLEAEKDIDREAEPRLWYQQATAELARRVLEFLFRARWDEGLSLPALTAAN